MSAPPIRFAQIEPVGECNLRCRMCPIQFRRDGPPWGPRAFMPLDTFRRLLDGMPGLESLHLQGMGEPLLHPRFFEMVREAAGRGIRVSTSTNLTRLDARRAALCVASGLHELHASLDGASAGVYESIRVRGRFDLVRSHLEGLVAARGGGDYPLIRLVMVVMRRNLHELPAMVRLASESGVGRLFVQHLCHDLQEPGLPDHYLPLRAFVEAETLLHEAPDRVARYFDLAREEAARLGIELRLPRVAPTPHPPGTPGPLRCDWPWRGPYIAWGGEAMPCCMVATPDRIQFGNMARQGVREVWEGEGYALFRDRLASGEPPEVCRSCALYRGTF